MATLPLAPERRGVPRFGRRALAFAVVLLVHVLLALVLLLLTPKAPPPAAPEPKSFQLLPSAEPAKAPTPAPRAKRKTRGAPPRAPAKPRKPTPAVAPPAAKSDAANQPFATELFDAIDIAKLPNVKNELSAGEGTAASGTGRDNDSVEVAGGGPNGERLFNAEWQREPTDAELSFYLPKTGVPQDSWAIVACKTVARYRVEDCQELGDSPPGSGLARAITNAAWQFRVLPPRVGGRALVGSWVRIRIDFSRGEAK